MKTISDPERDSYASFYEGKSKGESLMKSIGVREKFTAVDVFLIYFRGGLHLRNLLVSVETFIVSF